MRLSALGRMKYRRGRYGNRNARAHAVGRGAGRRR